MNFVSAKNHFTRIANLSLVLLCLTLVTGHSCFGQSGTRSRASSSDPYFSAESQTRSKEKTDSKVSDDPATQAIFERYHVTDVHVQSSDLQNAFEEGQVLAIVGGEPIFAGDLLFEANQLLEKFMPGAPEKLKRNERPKLIKRLLPKFIDQKLLYLLAQSKLPEGAKFEDIIKDAEKEFDNKALENLIEQSGAKSVVDFDAQLRAQGSSLRQMRRTWSIDQLVRMFVMKDIQAESNVTHHELLDYYRDNISEFKNKGRAQWEQVMISFAKSDSRASARQQLEELGNKIVYGASLTEVARKSSHGFNAHNGGQHEWTTQGSLVLKEVDQAIFSIPVGELSDIIETKDGFHIVRVLDREDANTTNFREAQVEIRKKLEQQKRMKTFEDQLAKLRRETPVEIFGLVDPPTRQAKSPQNGRVR